MNWLLRILPLNCISCLVGRLSTLGLPRPLGVWLIKGFARCYSIDPSQASRPLEQYRSISDFFLREFKPGLRPLPPAHEHLFLSPVDGTLRGCGLIEGGRIEQVKGRTYALDELLAGDPLGSQFKNGLFFNFYLSPADYHHVHAPLSGEIMRSIYIPGKLWPVNDWSVRRINGLFCINERLVTYIAGRHGLAAVIMIGAANVGKLEVCYDNWSTNRVLRFEKRRIEVRNYSPGASIRAGEKLGTFRLGSSVVVLCEPESFEIDAMPGRVLLNSALAVRRSFLFAPVY